MSTPELDTQQSFFDQHKAELQDVFKVIGHEADWNDDLHVLSDYMQQAWVQGDHWSPQNQEPFSDTETAAAKKSFDSMGFTEAITPPNGNYDQIVLLGGMMRANNARVEFTKQLIDDGTVQLAHGGEIVFWGGPRIRDKIEDAPTTELMERLLTSDHDPWLQRQLDLHADQLSPEQAVDTESEEGRAAMIAHFGVLSLREMHVPIVSNAAELPSLISARAFSRQAFFSPLLDADVQLINAPLVTRPMGDPRHTTESSAIEWLADPATAPTKDAQVLFVTSNPYIRRTAHVVNNVLKQQGRHDVRLVACGPGAYPEAKIQLFMGEIGRLLYEDQQIQLGKVS